MEPNPPKTDKLAQRGSNREKWLPCPSQPEWRVSSLGRVRSQRRILKPYFHDGAYRVGHEVAGVSRLVAEAFLGVDSPSVNKRIIHRNGNLADCRPANLLLVTRSRHDKCNVQRALALHAEGVTFRVIRLLTGIPKSTVQWYLKKRRTPPPK